MRALTIDISRCDIDPVHGFVAGSEPLAALPPGFRAWDALAAEMPALIRSRRLRGVLAELGVLDAQALPDHASRERAMLILTIAANAYVHGDAEPMLRLPAGVAVPLCALAEDLDRIPIVTHASIVLNNWRRIDPAGPLSVDNAETQVDFLGGVDERWFFIATLGVELAGAPALPVLARLHDHARIGDDTALATDLKAVFEALSAMRAAFGRMAEWCEPWVFYNRIRPFLAGWPEPGVVYEGVWEEPRVYLGGSAAQSTLIQAFDAALGIRHARPETAGFLTEMRGYMPAPHRTFLAALEARPDLNAHIRAIAPHSPKVARAYDACVKALSDLRREHMAMAARYISAQAPSRDNGIGTGGTEFVTFLRAAREETLARRMPQCAT